MKNIGTIIIYTVTEAVRKKSFIISTVIMFLLVILACNVPNIMNMFGGEEGTQDQIILVDRENVFGDLLKTIETNEIYNFKVESSISDEEIEEKIKNKEAMAAVVIKENESLSFDYITKENSIYSASDAEPISQMLKSLQIAKELDKINAPNATITNINTPISYNLKQLDENVGENFVVALVAAFLLFFTVYFYGYSVSTSVSSEKTSRVMETLVTSTKPATIVIGKTVGMGLVGLAQMISLIIVAVISYRVFIPEGFEALTTVIAGININAGSVLMCILYFILGYTVYAFLNAVTGATVSKAEDIQSANTPISLISVASFYLAYFTATVPNSPLNKFASIFPFSAAFAMPGRILAGGVAGWEIALSIVTLLATALLLAFISIKVYSAAILHYGDRLKISDLVKMFKSKD